MRLAMIVFVLLGCENDNPRTLVTVEEAEPAYALVLSAELTEGGPLVRMGEVTLPQGANLVVEANACQEVFLRVVEGQLDQLPAGTVTRLVQGATIRATANTRIVAAVVRGPDRPFPQSVSLCDRAEGRRMHTTTESGVAALPFAGGKLRVRIFHDAAAGASLGALSVLDADADLGVPEHVHEQSAEVLFIESGDGTLLLEGQRIPVERGQVIYIPPGILHGYEAGTERLVATQVYAPGGPEQRFRAPIERSQ